ncbi:polysaccharide pyruvyl transferase family protein [Halosquirtibacter laminarini]|uniref:Polysaccharide pyruvyl transferase family protein n=1 Tax=Halosquirtibacter laminarini TaxID=3374600 RepID=A0AC61NBM8_9BACT|nr:polysaccharide pyruvyl transferase family protein [Prolixibacteraceae bacterium]
MKKVLIRNYVLFRSFILLFLSYFKKIKLDNNKKIIITLLPSHNNLGDHALALAARKYAETYYSDYRIYEYDMFDIYRYYKSIVNSYNSNDLILVVGGGNMGSLYLHEEFTRRFIYLFFRKYNKLQMPVSVNFKCKSQLFISKIVYWFSRHNLVVCCRDSFSFKYVKDKFSFLDVQFIPDTVLFMRQHQTSVIPSGVGICLRQDSESNLSLKERNDIRTKIEHYNNLVREFTTTPLGKSFNVNNRESELNTLFNNITSMEFVVTDRLHGVIFSLINNTPFFAIKTNDHKLEMFVKDWCCDTESYSFEDFNNLCLSEDLLVKSTQNFRPYFDQLNFYVNKKYFA